MIQNSIKEIDQRLAKMDLSLNLSLCFPVKALVNLVFFYTWGHFPPFSLIGTDNSC